MFQNNPLLAQLKQQLKETLPHKEGIVKATEKGFGFLEVDNKTSIFIPPAYMKKVMHGDKVKAIIRTEREREVAEPEQLLEQSITRFIGRVVFVNNKLQVMPDNPSLRDAIRVKNGAQLKESKLAEGDWVVAQLTQHPLLKSDGGFLCEISEKVTSADDKIAPWWVTLAKHNLPNSEPALSPAQHDLQSSSECYPLLDQALPRQDLTALPFITIDSESTKDMDDALHTVQNSDGSFTLTIAIADPTAYVAPHSELDELARQRGFTIYLPGRNIPMLARELSDDICSLHEGQIRHALCCQVTAQSDGTLMDSHFFAATIKSHARLAYDQVSDWLDGIKNENFAPSEQIASQIKALHAYTLARIEWREQNAISFADRPDYYFELSDDNQVLAIHAQMRRIANRMIEEAMISANICAGLALQKSFGFGVFNSHDGFAKEKLPEISALLAEHGLNYSSDELASVSGFSKLWRELAARGDAYLENRFRKYQTISEVSLAPKPHFAMGLDCYATWTSPIRKYGDMVNHRLLKAMLLNEHATPPEPGLSELLARQRRLHRLAERDVADWLYVQLLQEPMQQKTVLLAEIFDINRAGMRVRLLENGASAFIPGQLILANKERIVCNGELGIVTIDGNTEFKLGDKIDVIINEIKTVTRSIIAKPTREFAPVAQ
ncbi:MAG: exoribonuclease II [Vibrionaceae bacterium]